MTTALDVAKSVYERFGAGDIEGFLRLCAQDIEWVVNGPATLEKCRAFRGRAGVQDFLRILDASWTFSDFTPKQFLAEGDTVVVLGQETGTDKNTGKTFENRWAHVFDIKDGQIARFREFLCHWPAGQTPPAMSWSSL